MLCCYYRSWTQGMKICGTQRNRNNINQKWPNECGSDWNSRSDQKKLHGEWINIKETVQNLHQDITKVLLTIWLEVQRSLWKQSIGQHLRVFLDISVHNLTHTGWVSSTGRHFYCHLHCTLPAFRKNTTWKLQVFLLLIKQRTHITVSHYKC